MSDLNSTLFFKSKFQIKPAIEGEIDLLWTLLLKIRTWMTRKWERKGETIPRDNQTWTNWKSGSTFSSKNNTVIFHSVRYFNEEHRVYWAAKIIETPPSENGCAPRTWTTEIGSCPATDGGSEISLVIYYADRPGFIGPCEPAPLPSVPGLIRLLLKDNKIFCCIGHYPVRLSPICLHPGDFPDFWKVVCDSERDIPIVYLSPSYENGTVHCALDPVRLADLLGPNALVYYTNDLDFSREMTHLCTPVEWGAYSGDIRIYASHPNTDIEESYRHRMIYVQNILSHEEDWYGILRRALVQDVHFYEKMFRIEDCRRLIEHSKQQRRQEEYKTEIEELLLSEVGEQEQRLKQKYEAFEQERTQWELSEMELMEQLDSIKSELRNATARADAFAIEAQLSSERKRALDLVRKLENYPNTPQAIVDYYLAHFRDRLAFTQRGYASLDDCSTDISILWNALYQMATRLYDLYQDPNVTTVEATFSRQSSFDIARGEGMMTRRDPKLMRNYDDVYQGRPIRIESHLKNGTKETSPQFLRIYYAWDAETQKIVIGSCGKHLTNYSTQKIG